MVVILVNITREELEERVVSSLTDIEKTHNISNMLLFEMLEYMKVKQVNQKEIKEEVNQKEIKEEIKDEEVEKEVIKKDDVSIHVSKSRKTTKG